MRTYPRFVAMLNTMGSDVIYHREDNGVDCPCKTPEGFRDPQWHRDNPTEPNCNEQGFITFVTVDALVKGSVQPPRMRGNRGAERVNELLGEVRKDDRIGIFPCNWNGLVLNFKDWSDAGEDYIIYDNNRYLVVEADKVPDIDGDPNGHWEVGMRLIKPNRP